MKKVYIAAAKRTPIGSFLGSAKSFSASELGAVVVKELLSVSHLDGAQIDEVIVGIVLSAGVGQGIARQVSIKGGIPFSVPAYAVNMVCGSGMKAIMNGFMTIAEGDGNLIIAGGTESMSNAPHLMFALRQGIKMGEPKVADHMLYDALLDAYSGVHMGITAENIAEKYGISRTMQDDFAMKSQDKAIAAVDGGRFAEEILPLIIKDKKGDILFDKDEYPNRTTSLEKLSKLRPAFKEGGSVTAGNSSGINDGASFVLLASENAVKAFHLTPLAEIIATGQGGVDPQFMGLGPVPAIENALKNAKLKLKDIPLIELNEAFAAQSLGVISELSERCDLPQQEIIRRTNPSGGAIALGHPLGCSGARIVVTLVHEMIKTKAKYGLASLCIGGGMGTAIILKGLE